MKVVYRVSLLLVFVAYAICFWLGCSAMHDAVTAYRTTLNDPVAFEQVQAVTRSSMDIAKAFDANSELISGIGIVVSFVTGLLLGKIKKSKVV